MVRLRIGIVSLLAFSQLAVAEPGFIPLPDLPIELAGTLTPNRVGPPPLIDETIRFAEPFFIPNGRGQVSVSLPGAENLRVETLPEMPMVVRTYAVGEGADADIGISWVQATKSPGPVPLSQLPETHYWTGDPHFQLATPNPGRFFPGKIARVFKEGGRLVVQLFPLQWDRSNGEMVRVESLRLQVYSRGIDDRARNVSSQREGLIVVGAAMLPAAKLLQDYHLRRYAVKSDVVAIETVEDKEKEIDENELPDGYKDRTLADEVILPYDPRTGQGYRYQRARKLISYLRKAWASGDAKYITLVGGADVIPPSYYFSVRSGFEAKFGATDQCYAAAAKCLEPKAVVGRLPLLSLDEVKTYLAKVERWQTSSETTPTELALYGGKAFGSPFYEGELGTLRTLRENADWYGVKKFFRTKRNYTKDGALEMLKGNRNSSIVYHLDHGFGNKWLIDKQAITSAEIDAISGVGTGINPVLFSVACTAGAFDNALLKESVFSDSKWGTQSIGMSLLRSPAGAVAYLGSARPVIGSPVFGIDAKGNLDLKDSTHALKLLDSVLESYRARGGGHLGDYVLESLKMYSTSPASDLARDRFKWTYLSQVFLGDPVMRLPVRKRTETALPLAQAVDDLGSFVQHFPTLALSLSGEFAIAFESVAPVRASLVTQWGRGRAIAEAPVMESDYPAGILQVTASDPHGNTTFFLRLENRQGLPVERQVWFQTTGTAAE